MTDQYESHAAQRLAEETGEPRERFTNDKPLPELDELESVTDGGVDQDSREDDRCEQPDCENRALFYLQPKTEYNPSGEYCRKHAKHKKETYRGQYEAIPLHSRNDEL